MKLNDKIIWITGASSGIGEALARALSNKGNTLILSARRKDRLEAVKKQCGNPLENTVVVPLDLEKRESFPEVYQSIVSQVGVPDVLINNAGIGQHGKIVDMSNEVEEKIMDINFYGQVFLTKTLLPDFIKRKSGTIITISSIVGKFGSPYLGMYSASKHALQGYFESLREEVISEGITVHLVYPGFINTEVTLNSLDRDGKPLNKNSSAQEKGMSPDVLAKKLISKIESGKNAMLIGNWEIYSVYFKGLFPRLFYWTMRKLSRKN